MLVANTDGWYSMPQRHASLERVKQAVPRATSFKCGIVGATCLCLGSSFAATVPGAGTLPGSAATAAPFPLQLEMRVPFAPTAFPSLEHSYVAYELYLTNFSASAINLRRVEVLEIGRAHV